MTSWPEGQAQRGAAHSQGEERQQKPPRLSPVLGGGDEEKLLDYLSCRKLLTFLARSPGIHTGVLSDSHRGSLRTFWGPIVSDAHFPLFRQVGGPSSVMFRHIDILALAIHTLIVQKGKDFRAEKCIFKCI